VTRAVDKEALGAVDELDRTRVRLRTALQRLSITCGGED